MAGEGRVKSVDERIRGEKQRLKKHYKKLQGAQAALAAGLIERAAFMRVQLEDLEADILENGWTEPFQQSANVEPYDRARPQGQTYQSTLGNYQKVIKLLDGLLPPAVQAEGEKDDFDAFVLERGGR